MISTQKQKSHCFVQKSSNLSQPPEFLNCQFLKTYHFLSSLFLIFFTTWYQVFIKCCVSQRLSTINLFQLPISQLSTRYQVFLKRPVAHYCICTSNAPMSMRNHSVSSFGHRIAEKITTGLPSASLTGLTRCATAASGVEWVGRGWVGRGVLHFQAWP